MTAGGTRPHDGKGKAPPSAGRRWLVGLGYFAISSHHPAGASGRNTKHFSTLSAIANLAHRGTSVSARDDDLRIKLGRIRDRSRNSRRPDTFIGEVMQAAKKAGHIGEGFGRGTGGAHRSRFGRGRGAALSLSLHSGSRVVTKARVVRHTGSRFRSAPLSNHVIYLKRDGVTHDGADARMFDARSDAADEQAFAEGCRDDRHHFRFIVSPEDAAELQDLRTFTRELMADAERDLGTRLGWVAVDHWNTDNPHLHVLIRGRGDDGKDLVISRAYISRGFRDRAAERVTLELGPRSEQEIRSALEKEVEAERWTSLDRALRDAVDEGAGVADLRPGAPSEDPTLRRLIVGRATKLERLGLAEQVAPGCWTLKPGIEGTLRDLSIRGDIIKTMHRAMTRAGREPEVSVFALQGEDPADPVLGRLVARGLHDELTGSAYAIVEGVDGRTHHVRFSDIEMTGDAMPGAIVEARAYEDARRPQEAVAGHAIRLDRVGTGYGERRDLARSAASRPRACDERWRIWRRGAGRDGPPHRSSLRRRTGAPPRAAGRVRSRSHQHLAAAGARCRRRQALDRDWLGAPPLGPRRACRRYLSSACDAGIGPVRHDR